jgi:transcriptional regulator with XRE-family HTH domain
MSARSVGAHIREWRRRRHLSQLDCALDADISQRHLSFIESGRAAPSRDMVLHLAEALNVPLRERNALLLAAGFAPQYQARALDAPALRPARTAVDLILKGHEPLPALAVDRHWTLVAANAGVQPLLSYVSDAALLKPPVNVLRLTLHPGGLAPHIANLSEWRRHLLERLKRQITITADPCLPLLLDELSNYSVPIVDQFPTEPRDFADIIVPLEFNTAAGRLSFLSTTSVFGTPVDITLSELVLECLFPADDATSAALRTLAAKCALPPI